VPARIEWQALNCPGCGEVLDQDRDGTACTRCQGLLVQRVWAERLLPALGRPVLPPVFQSAPKVLACPACQRAMAPVLCHGVAAWSCPRCRWLFLEGPRSRQLIEPTALPTLGVRELPRASMLQVSNKRARAVRKRSSTMLLDVLGILALAALVAVFMTVQHG
jgi:Zn-finger nucleic acid-binding protein